MAIKRFKIQTVAATVSNTTFVVTFSGIVPITTGDNYTLAEADNFRCGLDLDKIDVSVDAPENIGVSFSQSFGFELTDKVLPNSQGQTLYKLIRDAARFTADASLDTATPFSASAPAYSQGVYVVIEEQGSGAFARAKIFRGFIDAKSLSFKSQSGTPEDANGHIDATFSFDIIDRHAAFLNATDMADVRDAVAALPVWVSGTYNDKKVYFYAPDADVDDVECADIINLNINRNAIKETIGVPPVYTVEQTLGKGGYVTGAKEAFVSLQSICNVIAVKSKAETATALIDLSGFVYAYDPRYPYTNQFSKTDPYDPNGAGSASPKLTDLADVLTNGSKMFQLNDLANGGVDWSNEDVGDSWLEFGNASELLNEICETFGLIAIWNETSADVLQLQLKPRDLLSTTIDLDAQGHGILQDYSEEPYADDAKDFVVTERNGGEFNYPSDLAPTEERDDVTIQVAFKNFVEEEPKKEKTPTLVRQLNNLWWCNDQVIQRSAFTPPLLTESVIFRLHASDLVNGVVYGIGVDSVSASRFSEFEPRTLLIKSTDAGVTWYRMAFSVSDPLRDVHFISTSIGFLVGDNGAIYKTLDAGCTWEKKESGISESITQIYSNPDSTSVLFAKGLTKILTSTDTGETWTVITNPVPTGTFVKVTAIRVMGSAGGNRLVVSTISRENGATFLEIFDTATSGASWNSLLSFNVVSEDAIIRRFEHVNGGSLLFAVGGEITNLSLLLKSTNNGAAGSWSSLATNVTDFTDNNYFDVHFVDSNIGFICGEDLFDKPAVWKTSNGGTTWAKLVTFNTNDDIAYTIKPASDNGLIFVAGSGFSNRVIYRTTDATAFASTDFSTVTTTASPCPLLLGVKTSAQPTAGQYWDEVPSLQTFSKTVAWSEQNSALTYGLEFRGDFPDAFKKRSLKLPGRVLTFAQRMILVTLKFLFETKTHRALRYGYDAKTDTSEFDLMEITES